MSTTLSNEELASVVYAHRNDGELISASESAGIYRMTYSPEYPFRPDIDEIECYSVKGKLVYGGDEKSDKLIAGDDCVPVYFLTFRDEATLSTQHIPLPETASEAVKRGKSVKQLTVASRLKAAMKNRPPKEKETYKTIAENAHIPAKRGGGFLGDESVKDLITCNRYMTAAQAQALCGYLGCSIESIREGTHEKPSMSQHAAETLDYIEKALQLHDLIFGEGYLDTLIRAMEPMFEYFTALELYSDERGDLRLTDDVVNSFWDTISAIQKLVRIARH